MNPPRNPPPLLLAPSATTSSLGSAEAIGPYRPQLLDVFFSWLLKSVDGEEWDAGKAAAAEARWWEDAVALAASGVGDTLRRPALKSTGTAAELLVFVSLSPAAGPPPPPPPPVFALKLSKSSETS